MQPTNSVSSPGRVWPKRQHFRRFSNYGVAVASEILAGPLRAASRRWAGGTPTRPETWRRGLILGPDHIGDVLFNTPSLPYLRSGLPDCEWSFLTSETSAEVLRDNPHLARIITVDPAVPRTEWMRRELPALREFDFDVAINYGRGSPWQEHLLDLQLRLKIPNRVAYCYKGFSGLLTRPIRLERLKPYPYYFRNLVSQIITRPVEPPEDLRPVVYPQAEHEQRAAEAFARLGLERVSEPILACAVTSRQPSGVWPAEKFLETVQWVRERLHCPVVFVGSPGYRELLQGLAEKCGPGALVLTELDLRAMVAFLRRCRVALTPDSGTRHLAHAARIPVVFVRNLSTLSIEAGTYCATDFDMAPTELEVLTKAQDEAAFARIRPEAVGTKVLEILRQPAGEPA